jgi:hypothetical protein
MRNFVMAVAMMVAATGCSADTTEPTLRDNLSLYCQQEISCQGVSDPDKIDQCLSWWCQASGGNCDSTVGYEVQAIWDACLAEWDTCVVADYPVACNSAVDAMISAR